MKKNGKLQNGKKRNVKGYRKIKKFLFVLLLVSGVGCCAWGLLGQGSLHAVTVTAPFQPQYSVNDNPQSSMDLVASLCGIDTFRNRYGTDGEGQKIALIDSGIDLSHSAFMRNKNGSRKVAVYYDYTEEGMLQTQKVQREQDKVSADGTLYHIGGIYHTAEQFYMGFLQLSQLQPKPLSGDEKTLAVLVTATTAQYDCVYIDTNQNCDFTDEVPLYAYQEGGGHITVHHTGYPVNLVVSRIAADGSQVQMSADTLGHGTFLAGIIAANGEAYHGLAPEAQLCVYKIFDRDGSSSQQRLAEAIEQAVQDGVDCINLSLSIPHDEMVLPQLAAALELAAAQNIPVIAAAGNYGPGQNTIAYPAREPSVIGVGSYIAPEQYALDKAVMTEHAFVAEYSGRSNLSGTASVLLVAPSGVIATVPGWYAEDYMYDCGTSISAAIATAAVSHLQEYAASGAFGGMHEGTRSLSVEQIKSLLADWALDLQADAIEQGHGALYLGRMPSSPATIVPHETPRQQVTIQSIDNGSAETLYRQFLVPQGKAQAQYLLVPKDVRKLEAVLQIDTQQPSTPFEHLIAMGRCRMYLYDPAGRLVDQTDYLGAAYGGKLETNGTVKAWYPQEGLWELVVVSADNLSQYNHFETTGMLQITTK